MFKNTSTVSVQYNSHRQTLDDEIENTIVNKLETRILFIFCLKAHFVDLVVAKKSQNYWFFFFFFPLRFQYTTDEYVIHS